MTDEELRYLERELSIELPESYRQFMQSYPIPAYTGNVETLLWDNSEGLVRLNRDCRERLGWPPYFFALGDNASSDGYALDLREPSGIVWWIDHFDVHSRHSGPLQEPFAVWAQSYVQDLCSDLQTDGIDPEASPAERERLLQANAKPGCVVLLALSTAITLLAVVAVAVVTRSDCEFRSTLLNFFSPEA